ncbi:hypothetical protein [Paenibacillus apiarius]|uniref:Uncharacterized protein n=1 Tax=Paenibacillus apiarius TaxID=46240 RepID=A0ABT4DRR2_9BACL|nr:hypothetical protein [Paenibacillus apiarius]MBN3524477.1 hypothetical protein [Paenibacillus apiarius]MCY9515290.1 hypothetical protein [Paenibacillus apiarius]MCY9520039.1 hypothetical protein [Paenibacillus apiarius]MCY9554338.1 hypothetical protein [Paenibacillus apiarius]MCY9558129.1 hypothetical protein [Paenibacillus apiarius]
MFKNKVKQTLLVALAVSMLAPASLFAESANQAQSDRIYGPESGYSATYKKPFQTLGPALYLWSSSFSTTSSHQIKEDITIPSDSVRDTIYVNASSEKNTGDSTNYEIQLERYVPWSGWIHQQTISGKIGWQNEPFYFYKVKAGETYRLRIKGNVKGSIDVFNQ